MVDSALQMRHPSGQDVSSLVHLLLQKIWQTYMLWQLKSAANLSSGPCGGSQLKLLQHQETVEATIALLPSDDPV